MSVHSEQTQESTQQPQVVALIQATLEVVVAWQASWFEAPAAKSKRTSLDAIQRWVVRTSSKNVYGLEVISYNAMAKPFQYAPGFARL